jgi:hypothetical protein
LDGAADDVSMCTYWLGVDQAAHTE